MGIEVRRAGEGIGRGEGGFKGVKAKQRTGERERRLLLEAIEGRPPGGSGLRDLELAELREATGIPDRIISRLLPSLADEFGARIAVTEAGNLLWRFPARLVPRLKKARFRAALRRARALLLKSARFAAGFAYSLWFLVGSIWMRPDTEPGPREAANRPIDEERKFPETIMSFLFGGKDPDAEREAGEGQAFLEWAASRGGIVSPAEYALRECLGLEEAELRVISFAAEFGGEPLAAAPGFLAWRFPSASSARRGRPYPRFRRLPSFSDNGPTGDLLASCVSLTNISIGAFFMVLVGNANAGSFGPDWLIRAIARLRAESAPGFWAFFFLLGIGPLALGLGGSLLPAIRALGLWFERRRRLDENLRIYLSNRLLDSLDGGGDRATLPGAEEPVPGLVPDARKRMAAELDRLAARLGGEAEADGEGGVEWRFPALAKEWAAIEEARKLAPPRHEDKGSLIFDSGERL